MTTSPTGERPGTRPVLEYQDVADVRLEAKRGLLAFAARGLTFAAIWAGVAAIAAVLVAAVVLWILILAAAA